jgi:hypothetical protein
LTVDDPPAPPTLDVAEVVVLPMPPALLLVVDALLVLFTLPVVGPGPPVLVAPPMLEVAASAPSLEPDPVVVDDAADPAPGSAGSELQADNASSTLARPAKVRGITSRRGEIDRRGEVKGMRRSIRG